MMNQSEKILDLSDTWYHGTHVVATEGITEMGIDLTLSRKRLDFGPGFYLTNNYEQAVKQAVRKTEDYNDVQDQNYADTGQQPEYTIGTIMAYNLNLEELSHTKVHFFDGTDMDWALFILGNRTKKPKKFEISYHNRDKSLDAVYGPVADGRRKFFQLLTDIEKDRIDMPEFLRQISESFMFPYNNQLSLHTAHALSCLNLKEVDGIEVPKPHFNPGR